MCLHRFMYLYFHLTKDLPRYLFSLTERNLKRIFASMKKAKIALDAHLQQPVEAVAPQQQEWPCCGAPAQEPPSASQHLSTQPRALS